MDVSRGFGRAVQAMIEQALPGTDVYYGEVTTPDADLRYPYVVVWVIPAAGHLVNLSGSLVSADTRLQLTGVGRDPDEVGVVLDRAGDALRGHRPVVPGYRAGLIREMPVYQAVSKNEDLWWNGRPTYRSWSMYRLTLEPAPV